MQAVTDLSAIKEGQQQAWAAGDFSRFATTILIVSESLCETVDIHAGQRVLDVATGSGNTALCAARRNCDVTGIDYVPSLLERARERAAFEGLEVDFQEGDAEDLPYPDHSFDAVLSTFGVMFAPDQERVAAEMVRVCRPGGKIGMSNFTPESLAGRFFRTAAKYVPPTRGVKPPILWGTEDGVRSIFGSGLADLQMIPRHVTFRYRSAEHWLEFFRTYFGPIRTVHESLTPDRQEAFGRDLMDVIRAANRSGDETIVADVEYVEVLVTTQERGE
ncbi:MAG: class I SAM-dependent methyltransferase [Actinomycetota bacterium]